MVVLRDKWTGHRWAEDPLQLRIARDPTTEISIRLHRIVKFFIAGPLGNARSSRKFVFDELRWTQGSHGWGRVTSHAEISPKTAISEGVEALKTAKSLR